MTLQGVGALEVDCHKKERDFSLLPKYSHIPTPFYVIAVDEGESFSVVSKNEDTAMRALIGGVLGSCHSKSLSAPRGEVLASAGMLLLVKVCFNEDVKLALSRPIPLNDLFAKTCAIGKVELHGFGIGFGPFAGCWVKRWLEVWTFRSRQCPGYVVWCSEVGQLDGPKLNDVLGNLGCQVWDHPGRLSIVGNPQKIPVH